MQESDERGGDCASSGIQIEEKWEYRTRQRTSRIRGKRRREELSRDTQAISKGISLLRGNEKKNNSSQIKLGGTKGGGWKF